MEPQMSPHRQAALAKMSNEGRKFFKFIEYDENEELVTEIRKHPIGLFFITLTGIFIAVVTTIILGFIVAVDMNAALGLGLNGFKPLIVLVGFLLVVGSIIMTFISAWLYKNNVIYVTNEKIAQVLYITLFNRKISQLSIGDVQDVTVTQKGILAHAFNYGTLVVETAGEQQNYTFTFVPKPYESSQLIVGAHERNLAQYGN